MTVASVVGDVISGFRAGSKSAKTWGNFFTDALKSADSQTYKSYSEAMGIALTAEPALIKTFTNAVDDDTIMAVLKNSDREVAEALVKNMKNVDTAKAALRRVAAADPALARTLNFADVKASSVADLVVRQGGTTKQATEVSKSTPIMMKNQDKVNAAQMKDVTPNDAKNVPDAESDEVAKEQMTNHVRDKGGVSESATNAEVGEAIENGGKIAENSGTVRKALEKLGIIAVGSDIATFTRKHWMKMGAAMVILCMAYDTNNPFTALDRALDDVDDMVDGLKELADSAFEMAKDAAEGTFDLIAFLTENWWMSLICCCLILLIGVAATLS